ncbi:hypothetical protein LX32DRAFT_642472 [Colletotrichum zoysiae]|uniref:Uncharacterized protein n=1 Tax=Colletotrichum zoysiae TaxID=1216348 RepID=A0AAD9HCB7_9PEZI|nr:hypothetical protein LX32DRAFT_642472 [Colletotrichum zoysiae]
MKTTYAYFLITLMASAAYTAPTPVAEANPENVDAGHFLEKAYIWGSYKKVEPEGAAPVVKREANPEANPENVDAGHFLEKAYIWGSYKKVGPEGAAPVVKREANP